MARAKKPAPAKPSKATKEPKAKKAEVRTVDQDGVEVVEGGMSFEDGIVLTTTVLLIAAVVLAYFAAQIYA